MQRHFRTLLCLTHAAIVFSQIVPVLDASTDSFVHNILKTWESPTGVAIAVVRQDTSGWHVEAAGYGPAKLDGSQNVTENTLFGIGSNSKLFTAITTGLLIHDSRISPPLTWTSKLRDILPGWGLVDEIAGQEAVVQDLLSHRTGVPRHDGAIRRADTATDIIRKVRNHRPSASFRDIYQYNNNMYKILSILPPTLLPSRQPFARYVKENIFDKLGLSSTTYSYALASESGKLADAIGRDTYGGKAMQESSSAADLVTWIQALLLNGANPKTNESVIPADVIQKVSTGISVQYGVARFQELSPVVYGAGQERGSYRGHEFIEHTGAAPGYNTVIARYPNSNYGIAVLSNDNELGAILMRIIQYYLVDRIFGLDVIDWDSRYQAIYLNPGGGSGPTPRPANATFPYGDIKRIEGVYHNAGYGKLEFCYVTASNSTSNMVTGGSKSCNELRARVSTALPGVIKPDTPTFVAEWNAASFTHLVLQHFDGPLFNISVYQSWPSGNSSSPYWAQDLGYSCLGEVDAAMTGIGFTGIWDAAAGVPKPSGNTPKERAEAWFAKS